MNRMLARAVAGLFAFAPASAALAADWPGWRGAEANGVAASSDLPTEVGAGRNVRWHVALPGPGNGSPVILGDKVFVAQAVAEGNRRTLICLDRATGKQLWQSGVEYAKKEPTHDTNPYCSGTPATDGKHVYVCFGSAGVFAYDLAGKEVWRRDLGTLSHIFGNAVSPVLHGDLLIMNYGPDDEHGRLVALKKSTGETAWEAPIPSAEPAGDPGQPGKFGMGIMVAGSFVQGGDKNGDEELSREEFTGVLAEWFGKIDAASAGKLTKPQFVGGLDAVLPPMQGMGGKPTKAGGGDAKPQEPKPAAPASKPAAPGFTPGNLAGPGIFDAADADKDGTLTRAELSAAAEKWFPLWDTDKNGRLDENEIREGLNAVLPAFPMMPPAGAPSPTKKKGGMGSVPTGSWVTPVVVKAGGREELVCAFPGVLAAFDPASGKPLWTWGGLGMQVYTSPLVGDGFVVAMSSGMEGGRAVAVRTGGSGDVSKTHLHWRNDRVKGAIGTGVLHDGRLLHVGADGVAECLDANTGKKLWQKRLGSTGGQSGVWASLLLAGDKAYVANQSGDLAVLKVGPKFEEVASTSVGEPTNASPAAADGHLFLRTEKGLWCFGAKR
ncbi:MAG TPA: PQQ-binding-like beta-propeller repeat protein [Humisphaera sp.]